MAGASAQLAAPRTKEYTFLRGLGGERMTEIPGITQGAFWCD